MRLALRLGAFARDWFSPQDAKPSKSNFNIKVNRRTHMVRHLLAPCVLSLGCLIVLADHKAVSKAFPIKDVEPVTVVSVNLPTQSQLLLPREQEIELALKAVPVHL